MVSLLPPPLRQLFQKIQWGVGKRVYSLNTTMISRIEQFARTNNRREEDVLDDILEEGFLQVLGKDEGRLGDAWDSLTLHQQRIACLLCLDFSSQQIAVRLNTSYDSVRYHSKVIYKRFGLNRKELRQALKDWKLVEWLERQDFQIS